MIRTIGFLGFWLALLIYAFILAPPNDPKTFELIEKLLFLEVEDVNPLLISIFNLMGILPLMYASLLLIDGQGQKLWAWLFVILSFGIGAFAILPYLAFRKPHTEWLGPKNWLLNILDSRFLNLCFALSFLLILIPGVLKGDWNDFIVQWQTTRFVNVMTVDFCVLILLFPALLQDDLNRRNLNDSPLFKTLIWIPLIGPLIYFSVRPSLPETEGISSPRNQPDQVVG